MAYKTRFAQLEARRTYDGAEANLDRLEHVQHQLSALAREDQALTESSGPVNLPREIDGLERGRKVRQDTRHTERHSLLGDTLQAEGLANHFL